MLISRKMRRKNAQTCMNRDVIIDYWFLLLLLPIRTHPSTLFSLFYSHTFLIRSLLMMMIKSQEEGGGCWQNTRTVPSFSHAWTFKCERKWPKSHFAMYFNSLSSINEFFFFSIRLSWRQGTHIGKKATIICTRSTGYKNNSCSKT